MSPEDDYSFECPYCWESVDVRLDAAGGSRQIFTVDCEVCCRPIQISVRFMGRDVAAFEAVSES